MTQDVQHPNSDKHEPNEVLTPQRQKRVKREADDEINGPLTMPKSLSKRLRIIPDSDADSDAEEITLTEPTRKTGLEDALPPIKNEQEAIDEYEASRAAEAETDTTVSRLKDRKWVKGRSSIYVDAFNLALDTVLEEESHLFDEAEKALFKFWEGLSYEAQYLYVRLFLRKTSAWHRINSLGYHADIADLDAAIEELQQVRDLPTTSAEPEFHPGELEPPTGTTLESSFTFADKSDLITTLEEASSLLKLPELKALAKEAKVVGKNKKELLQALRRSSKQQTGILRRSDTTGSIQSGGQDSSHEDESESPQSRQETPGVDDERNRDNHFKRKIMNETGPCIRLTLAPLKLFERVHLVFYRSTEWTEKSLTAIILARIARWNFPDYVVSRSASVFGSRALLVEFEASLRTQNRVDNILEFNGKPTAEGYQTILDIQAEVYPRWRTLLAKEQRKETHVYQSGEGAYLRRLSPAWVYTRILHKAADVLGKLKRHKDEHRLLCELLDQRLFHHARRGAWYQRRALLEEHYMHALVPSDGKDEDTQKRHWKRVSLKTCEDGIQDSLVHLIYHYDLQKRIMKIEKSLKIPKREQHDFSHVRLAAPAEVTIKGIQIIRDTPPQANTPGPGRPKSTFRGTKTIWLDPLEDNGECSVEAMCLSHYRALGYRGYHSEGGIVRTLFAYLFYDILFTYIPNVFQTPFQISPLDLHTDAFYPTRLSEITRRLNDIANGDATLLIKQIYDAHHEKQTCVVGLDWSYDIDDLLEIAEFFDGEALATVCKVMAQEYSVRGGGVPDLFLWHPEKREVRFAEVKSENDRLSDTQRLWIHVLTGAGIMVDLANAKASEVRVVPA